MRRNTTKVNYAYHHKAVRHRGRIVHDGGVPGYRLPMHGTGFFFYDFWGDGLITNVILMTKNHNDWWFTQNVHDTDMFAWMASAHPGLYFNANFWANNFAVFTSWPPGPFFPAGSIFCQGVGGCPRTPALFFNF